MPVPILAVAQGLLMGLSVVAAIVALRGAHQWRHHRNRAVLAMLCGALALANLASLAAAYTTDAMPSGWLMALELLPQAGLPCLVIALILTISRRQRHEGLVRRAAAFNALTGWPNRTLLQQLLRPTLAHCRREGLEATMLVVRLDDLPALRAAYGPVEADEYLHRLADTLAETTRASDLAGHVSDDALGALLPGTGPEAARIVAKRLLRTVAGHFHHPAMDGRRLRLSIGIAAIGDGIETAALDEAISAALQALEEAYAAGGDRLAVAPPPPPRQARYHAAAGKPRSAPDQNGID